MIKNDRVVLLEDYSGYYKYHYKAGQQGRVITAFNNNICVEWDGFEAEKESAEIFSRAGESPNIIKYCAEIPCELLDKIERTIIVGIKDCDEYMRASYTHEGKVYIYKEGEFIYTFNAKTKINDIVMNPTFNNVVYLATDEGLMIVDYVEETCQTMAIEIPE